MSKKEPKTSLEDMMEDLQRAGIENQKVKADPELVTRADGSQMMRVKKRKRRSDQSRNDKFKKKRKRKFFLVVGCVALFFLSILGGVIGLAYYNSKKFHKEVQNTIALSSGSETELGLLSVGITSANTDEVSLVWPKDQGPIEELKLREVDASYTFKGLLGGKWSGPYIQASSGVLTLRDVTNFKFGGSDKVPVNYSFDSYGCRSLDIHMGGVKNEPTITKADVTLKLNDGDRPQIELDSGLLNFEGFEDLNIESGLLTFGETEGELILRLMTEIQGSYLSLNGAFPYNTGQKVNLSSKLESYPLVRLLPDDSRRFFEASIDSEDISFVVDTEDGENLGVSGSFEAKRFILNDFQFLNELVILLGRKWYERPRFTRQASGKILRKGESLEISDLILEEGDYLKVTGGIKIDADGKVSGTLRVGVPIGVANLLRDRVTPGMFSSSMEGYVWTDVRLSGTTVSVSDDFASKLIVDSPIKRQPVVEPEPRKKLEDEFDSLTE